MKKICDTFELWDETFYTSVLLNDLQTMAKVTRKFKDKKRKLEDIFDFTKVSNGKDKWARYETFFEAVACIVICIKFYEHEKESPFTKEILEFFEIENLAPLVKCDTSNDSLVDEKHVIDVLYDFVCAKQLEILLKIEFKIPTAGL